MTFLAVPGPPVHRGGQRFAASAWSTVPPERLTAPVVQLDGGTVKAMSASFKLRVLVRALLGQDAHLFGDAQAFILRRTVG